MPKIKGTRRVRKHHAIFKESIRLSNEDESAIINSAKIGMGTGK